MLFERRKPLDLILETAAKRSLTRQLNAFDLTMLGIGAVIGTGIFVSLFAAMFPVGMVIRRTIRARSRSTTIGRSSTAAVISSTTTKASRVTSSTETILC